MNLVYPIRKRLKLRLIGCSACSKSFLWLLVFCITLTACNGSKAFYKRGFKLEKQGLIDEAAASYYGALQRNRNNIEAKVGLKNTGQTVLNKKLEAFTKSRSLDQKREGVYSFIRAQDYQAKIKKIGVTLEIPSYFESDYAEITQSYLLDLYNEGTELLDKGQFTAAELKFKEIGKFDSNYKDSGVLKNLAYLEPLYKKALEHLENKKFRSAYSDFDKIIDRDPNFKEAQDLKDQSLELGIITLAVIGFENGTNRSGLDKKVTAYSLDALTSINDPFLKVIDRENFDLIIGEQQLGMSGVIDEETAVTAGNLIGAKTLLTGTVLTYGSNEGRLQKTALTGYESYKVKKLNKETNKNYYETKYRTTNYTKYQKKNTVNVSFQYKITSLETGEVIKSRIIEDSMEDVMVYGMYDGDHSNLYPSRVGGAVNTNRNSKNELNRLLNGKKTISSTEELSTDLMKDLSYKLSSDIGSFIKNKVK